MKPNLDIFREKTGKILYDEMNEIIEKSIEMLEKEFSPHIRIKKTERLIVVGDLHGDLDSLLTVLEKSDLISNENSTILFLGDYGDRGLYQVETYFTILTLKILLKDRIVLLRGNHEIFNGYETIPHDFPRSLLKSFGYYRAQELYEKFRKLWDLLPYSASYNKIFFVHGGLPINTESKEQITNPDDETILQFLWNDPMEENGYKKNVYRNLGYTFGPDITKKFIETTGFEKIIRGHEVCNGFKENHDGRILTVFSTKAYNNKNAGFLIIENNKEKRIIF